MDISRLVESFMLSYGACMPDAQICILLHFIFHGLRPAATHDLHYMSLSHCQLALHFDRVILRLTKINCSED